MPDGAGCEVLAGERRAASGNTIGFARQTDRRNCSPRLDPGPKS